METRNAVYTYEIDNDPNELVVDLTELWVLAARPPFRGDRWWLTAG